MDLVRVVRPVSAPFEVTTKNTIGASIFGRPLPVPHWAMVFMSIGWWITTVTGALATLEIIDKNYAVIGLLSIPLVGTMFCCCCVRLVVKILRSFDALYILANVIGLALFFSIAVQGDIRTVFFFSIAPSSAMAIFTDALPASQKRLNTIYFYINNIVALCCLQVSLFFELIRMSDYTFSLGGIRVTASGMASTCIVNLLIFGARNIFTFYRHRTSLVMVKSRMESIKVDKSEAVEEKRIFSRRSSSIVPLINESKNNEN